MDASVDLAYRAQLVRLLARRIDQSLVRKVPLLVGDDTWRGPLAVTVQDRLFDVQVRLDHTLGQLYDVARSLEAAAAAAAVREAGGIR
ncbi:MAG: hypothetical protein ACKO91_07730 [Acidimicrobiales bacterium]